MGDTLLKILIVEYVIICISYLWQRDIGRALYFFGAIVLSVGVLMMK